MLLTCPSCRSGLQVPEGTTALVRCPTCKTVFSPAQGLAPLPPEPVEQEAPETREEERTTSRLLTCPTCRSGLQVPKGTTALVRCPACKTVFSPEQGLSSPPPEPAEEKERPPTRKHTRGPREEEDERPRRKPAAKAKPEDEEEEAPKSKNRDFDPADPDDKPRKRRLSMNEEGMSSEERAELKKAFGRAAWGAKLIWISIILYMLSMVMIVIFWFQFAFTAPSGAFLILAGMMGMVNWLLALVGVGLCLSGPPSEGHWGFGIAAVVATVIHLLMLLGLMGMNSDVTAEKSGDFQIINGADKWAQVPTRMDTVTMFSMLFLVVDQSIIPKAQMIYSIAVGIAEIIRITLIMMLLSCLGQAAGDKELSLNCTRAAGRVFLGPTILTVVIMMYVSLIIQTGAQGVFVRIITMTMMMGIYAVLGGILMPALETSREVFEACEEPFQSQLPQF